MFGFGGAVPALRLLPSPFSALVLHVDDLDAAQAQLEREAEDIAAKEQQEREAEEAAARKRQEEQAKTVLEKKR